MSAVRALIAMSAERDGATARDGQQHFFGLSVFLRRFLLHMLPRSFVRIRNTVPPCLVSLRT